MKIISQREYVHWCDPGHYAHDAAAGHLAPSQAVTKRGSSNVNFTSTAKWVLDILGRCYTKLLCCHVANDSYFSHVAIDR